MTTRGQLRRTCALPVLMSLFVATAMVSAESRNQSHTLLLLPKHYDHLIPLDPERKQYRQLLESKLAVTPFDCGRSISTASLGPEHVVSVYSTRSRYRGTRYYTTATESIESVWELTDGMAHPAKAKDVRIRRFDVELPSHTALAIQQVTQSMLQQTHRPGKRKEVEDSAIMRVGYTVEFSIERPRRHMLRGAINGLDGGLPALGTNTHRLMKLYDELLFNYCQAMPKKRMILLATIDRHIRYLYNRLLKDQSTSNRP